MRKSSEVPLKLLAALAKFVTGRSDVPETCYCVDEQRRIVPDINCQTSSFGTSFHYIYGGSSGGNIGDTVVGGSTMPSNERGVFRGGFGYSGGGKAVGG
jgi:hypothetical protein